MYGFSEIDKVGQVDSFRTILPNKKISENISCGKFEYNKPKRRNIDFFDEHANINSNQKNTENTLPYYKTKHINVFALFVSIVFIGILVFIATATLYETARYTTFYKSFGAEKEDPPQSPYKAMCVIEPNSGREILGYNSQEKMYMASTTKIMTLLVALENISDYQKEVVVDDSAVGIEGTSIYLKKGEKIKIIDLMYGLMLASGNDSAVALAIIASGSENNFVKLMNDYAKKLNLKNTHFDNPHGLHSETHYTTAYELAKITATAMQNETFRKIVSTKRYTIPKTNCTNTERFLKNKQKLLFDDNLQKSGFVATGVKSGFTPEAGRCLVSSATISNKELISVVLNCPDMFVVSEKLLKEAEQKFEVKNLIENYSFVSNVPVQNSKTASVKVYTKAGFSYPIFADEKDAFNVVLNLPEYLSAPIKKDEVVGNIKVMQNGVEIFSCEVYSFADVKEITLKDIASDIIKQFV